ncbi:Hsp20/alpha crystallin family protein [Deinococcus peraridilitoris]|uniref:Molecular chaperone (Small heat shock protein) n=1 Tax=Deinococcus peraridilitoris (strain DSM 19664 / LMG 22246 / CIP 109416 / KR-200) TaxID=937777 RepID=L0A7L3_DEIPD|nr:Hsp20/alpha crystallin family protein [Deinococcus peraridilitoris]AFZ69152.1 molecular chaperone (small heat shock protein) [Deinococcus peraridilitoris DSM 19664]
MSGGSEPVLRRINSLMQLRQEVEALSHGAPWAPPADWLETDTELLLIMDVPGVESDAFELIEEENTVVVRGQRPPPETDGSFLSVERPQGSFQRTFSFPVETVPGTGQAQLRAGVLVIRFEKRHKIIDHE